VNVDPEMDAAKAQQFILQKKIEVPMMLPNQRQAIKSYGVLSLPRIVIIDQDYYRPQKPIRPSLTNTIIAPASPYIGSYRIL